MRLALLFIPFCLQAQPTVTWSKISSSGGVGYTSIRNDPVSGQNLVWKSVTGSGIFASNIVAYTSAGTTTNVVGTSTTSDVCPADIPYSSNGGTFTGSLPNRPGDRHPVSQQAIDTKRNFLWIEGGVINDCSSYSVTVSGTTGTLTSSSNFATDGSWSGMNAYVQTSANCPTVGSPCTIQSVTNGTTLVFASPPGDVTAKVMFFVDKGNGSTLGIRSDMFYLTLNATPTSDLYTRVFPTNLPTDLLGGSFGYQGALAYDSTDDMLFHLEGTKMLRYCSTIPANGGAATGTLSGDQTTAGCTTADSWTLDAAAAPGIINAGFVFDPVNQIFWAYGSGTGFWAYNPSAAGTRFGIGAKAWKHFCLSCSLPPAESSQLSMVNAAAWDSVRNTMIYWFAIGAGYTGSGSYAAYHPAPTAYEYNPANDTLAPLSGFGTSCTKCTSPGPVGDNGSVYNGVQVTFDPATNAIYSYAIDGVWKGLLSAVPGGGSTGGGAITISGKVTQ